MHASSKFVGWKLREAIRRTGAPESLRGYATALRAFKKRRQGSGRRAWPSPYMIGRQNFNAYVARQEQEDTERTLLHREQELKSSLVAMLKQGTLVAYGKRESVMADQRMIPPPAWDMLHIKSVRKSVVIEKTKAKAEIVDVRVFPIIEAPDAVDFLSGLPLIEAFDRYLFNDPQRLALAARAAEGGGKPLARSFEQRLYGAFWPVWFGNCFSSCMGRAVMTPRYPPLKARTEAICLSADRVLSERFGRLMEYLSAGTLVAQGLPPSGGVMIPIPRALWQNRRIHFDLENGNVVQYLPDESPESSVSYRPLFLAVTLESPDKTLHVKPMGHEHAPSITTEHSLVLKEGKGESQVRNRDDAEQACREWLIALMEESPKERKQTVSELWQQAEKKWPNLTRKAFHRAKAGAVTFTGALAWAKSGAPRKGDSKDRKLSRIAVKYPSP